MVHVMLQIIMYMAVVAALLSFKPVRSLLTSLPVTYRAIMVTLVCLAVAAQSLSAPQYTFPIVHWKMFSKQPANTEDMIYYEFVGVTASGKRVFVRPPHAIPWLDHNRLRFLGKLERLLEHGRQNRAADDSTLKINGMLRGMGRAYNHWRQGDPLLALEVNRCTFRLSEYTDASSIERRLIWRVELGRKTL